MPAALDRVQHRLDDGRRGGADALLGDPGELHGLASVAEVDGLAAHGEEHVRAVGPVAGGLGEAQCLDEVALGESVGGDVVRGPAGQPGEVGGGGEEAPADGFAVRAAQHRLGLVLQVADEGLAGVAAAVGVVEGAEELADGAERGDVAAGDPLAGRPVRAALPGHGEAALGRHPGVVGEADVMREPAVRAADDAGGGGRGRRGRRGAGAGGRSPRATRSSARPMSQSRLGTTRPAGVKAILRSSAWLPESLRQSPLTMSTASSGVAANSRPA